MLHVDRDTVKGNTEIPGNECKQCNKLMDAATINRNGILIVDRFFIIRDEPSNYGRGDFSLNVKFLISSDEPQTLDLSSLY